MLKCYKVGDDHVTAQELMAAAKLFYEAKAYRNGLPSITNLNTDKAIKILRDEGYTVTENPAYSPVKKA